MSTIVLCRNLEAKQLEAAPIDLKEFTMRVFNFLDSINQSLSDGVSGRGPHHPNARLGILREIRSDIKSLGYPGTLKKWRELVK
jgi:hypothetical protein